MTCAEKVFLIALVVTALMVSGTFVWLLVLIARAIGLI
jgi:cell division protein FtsL